jgi:hypothetical protein
MTAAPVPRAVASTTKTMCLCLQLQTAWRGEAEQPTMACADER